VLWQNDDAVDVLKAVIQEHLGEDAEYKGAMKAVRDSATAVEGLKGQVETLKERVQTSVETKVRPCLLDHSVQATFSRVRKRKPSLVVF
jgi:hypothetical protein